MGILEWLGFRSAAGPLNLQPASPWADNDHLTSITAAELYKLQMEAGVLQTLTREQALAVPSVAAARHRIVGTLSRLPLVATSSEGGEWTRALSLINQPDDGESHVYTMRKTLDDLLFDGRAWWVVVQTYSESKTFPRSIVHVPLRYVDNTGRLNTEFVRWLREARGLVPVAHPQVGNRSWLLYFEGPHAGLLSFGQRSIRAAAAMERAAGRAAENPVPSIELHQTSGPNLDPTARAELINGWAAARRGENGGVAYTSPTVDVRTHGQSDAQLLVDGRNQSAVDVARLVGIPASSIDAGLPGASITYANLTERMVDMVNMGLQPYASAVTSRLSMDDVLPQGVSVRFNYSELYPATPAESPTPAPAGTKTGATQ